MGLHKNGIQNTEKGSYDYRTDVFSNISIIIWHDNRCVHVISSYKGINPIEKTKHWSSKDKKHTGIDVEMFSSIREYNSKMGGVDL